MDTTDEQLLIQPTPDYGSLGPGPDLPGTEPITPQAGKGPNLAALLIGLVLAGGVGAMLSLNTTVARFLDERKGLTPIPGANLSGRATANLDRDPQVSAEFYLQRAVGGDKNANQQIAQRVDGWREHVRLNPKLNSLIRAALNSNDFQLRATGIEVKLAAVAVAKTPEAADRLMLQAASGPPSERIFALWTLGLLGNRGVETARVTDFLVGQLQDSNPEIRRWTVGGLSYLGTDETIEPLLQALHDDPSPLVREAAAAGLARAGMLSREQRQTAVPKLVDFAGDPSLDAPTRTWVYHALHDITAQNLPDNAAWRNWYKAQQN
jgi:hypothetical protein